MISIICQVFQSLYPQQAPNPDEGQFSRLNREKRWGWEEGKEKTLHSGSSLAACWEWGWEDRCHSSGRLGVFESIGCMDCFLGRSQWGHLLHLGHWWSMPWETSGRQRCEVSTHTGLRQLFLGTVVWFMANRQIASRPKRSCCTNSEDMVIIYLNQRWETTQDSDLAMDCGQRTMK